MQIVTLIEKHQVKFRHTLEYKLHDDKEAVTINDQDEACKNSLLAYLFAKDIPGADIEYCQEHACKDPEYAFYFAGNIPGADIEYCRKACEHNEDWLNRFDRMIAEKNANIKRNRKTPC